MYNLDGYDIMAFNQNLYDKNEWDFYFRNHTVALYCGVFQYPYFLEYTQP